MRQHSLVFCLALVKNRQTKTARHLSRRKFCANLLDIDAAWLTPSKEKSSKLAKNNKRETKRFESLYPCHADTIIKPPLSPPAILFPIVWSVLYALMGIGAARISLCPPSAQRKRALYLYAAQLAFNFFWSIIFFRFQAFGFALIWLLILWALILWMILAFRKLDTLAGGLQIPYLLWVSFAGYLNAGVLLLNSVKT